MMAGATRCMGMDVGGNGVGCYVVEGFSSPAQTPIPALPLQFFSRDQILPSRQNHLPAEIQQTRQEQSECAKGGIGGHQMEALEAGASIETVPGLGVHRPRLRHLDLERIVWAGVQ